MECLMKMLACDEQAVATLDSLHDHAKGGAADLSAITAG